MSWKAVLRFLGYGFGLVVFLFVAFLAGAQTGFFPLFAGEMEQKSLRVTNCETTDKGTLSVGVVDTFSQSYVGLSRTESLEPDQGLLFPYEQEKQPRIEMRNMDFGLDVIFVGSDGVINEIEEMPAPEGLVEYYLTYDSTYAEGQYVIEVPMGWSAEHGVAPGDCVEGLAPPSETP